MVDLFTKNLFGEDECSKCKKNDNPHGFGQFIVAFLMIYILLSPVVLLLILLSIVINALMSFF